MKAEVTQPEESALVETPGSSPPVGDAATRPVVEGFTLLEEIGRGGMGLIYRARDNSLDRDIAIKFLQEKYDTGSTFALRFLEEARITGRLQHPGIPAVHEVGKLATGRPYLVMKLIQGHGLQEIIWQKQADGTIHHVVPANYLGIFEAICQAVGYAHAHDVIHRDLKPHNIMVGAFGEVQVMDWGLAKTIDRNMVRETQAKEDIDPQATITVNPALNNETSSLTVAGSVLGTPGYMPPEQAIGANETLDARADVFGLGAILAALLTGKPAFVGDTSEGTRLLAAMGMVQACYDRLDDSAADPDIIELAKRCLAVHRVDRPRDAGEVAKEVARLRAAADERAKAAELVRAKAEVQVAEQRRRRRITLVASSLVVLALVCGLAASLWGMWHAAEKEKDALNSAQEERKARTAEAEQRSKAVAKEAETQSILDFVLNRVIAAARPMNWEGGKGVEVKLRDALHASLQFITEEFRQQPAVEGRLRQTLGESFWFLGEYPVAEKEMERALELLLKQRGPSDRQTLDTMLSLAKVKASLGQHPVALDLREQVYQRARETCGQEDLLTQRAMNALAASYDQAGRKADVLKLREEVTRVAEAKLGKTHAFTLLSRMNLALTQFQQGRHEQAIVLLRETARLQEQQIGAEHAYTLATLYNLAVCLDHMGRYPEAEPLHLKVLTLRQASLGADHPDTLKSMRDQAFNLLAQGRQLAAYETFRTALPLHEKRLGREHAETLHCLRNNITCLFDLKRSGEAIPLINDCLQRSRGLATHKELESVMHQLRFRHEHSDKQQSACETTLASWEKLLPLDGENTLDLAVAWALLAELKKDQAAADKAMHYLQESSTQGWNVLPAMEKEASLTVLQGRDDFRVLLGKLKAPR
jgi:serine/threonine protein kinase